MENALSFFRLSRRRSVPWPPRFFAGRLTHWPIRKKLRPERDYFDPGELRSATRLCYRRVRIINFTLSDFRRYVMSLALSALKTTALSKFIRVDRVLDRKSDFSRIGSQIGLSDNVSEIVKNRVSVSLVSLYLIAAIIFYTSRRGVHILQIWTPDYARAATRIRRARPRIAVHWNIETYGETRLESRAEPRPAMKRVYDSWNSVAVAYIPYVCVMPG